MPIEWIKACDALNFASTDSDLISAIEAICKRAHAGKIAAKAETFHWGDEEKSDCLIPRHFWWAEGHEALDQDWKSGDFSTWIDEKIQVKAFGVSFDFVAVTELVPVASRPTAMAEISVVGNAEWLSAFEINRLLFQKYQSGASHEPLLELCRTGHAVARALRVTMARQKAAVPFLAAVEWDVPLWFWRDFVPAGKRLIDWKAGRFEGDGTNEGKRLFLTVQGLHFHRSALALLGLDDGETGDVESSTPQKRGRKPSYDWDAAVAGIWGEIYRGDLQPKNQAEIERAFQSLLARGDSEPSESTVRPYAKRIWEEMSREA